MDEGEEAGLSTAKKRPKTTSSSSSIAKKDDDDEEHNQPVACWRLDPNDTYSDFKIMITPAYDSSSISVYHTHKAILTHGGQNASEYFLCLLRNGGQFADKDEITIELYDGAAAHFPSLLDYLYIGKLKGDIPPEETIALLHLGDRFGVSNLVKEMDRLISEKLQSEDYDHLKAYLPYIVILRNEPSLKRIYRLVQLLTLQMVFDVKKHSEELSKLVEGMDITFVTEVLHLCHGLVEGYNLVEKTQDNFTSVLAAKFLAAHAGEINEEEFADITSESILPQIAPEVALQLLDIEADIVKHHKCDGNLTSLQNRCSGVIGKHLIDNEDRAKRVFNKLSYTQLVDMFARSITKSSTPSSPLSTEEHHGRINIQVISCDPIPGGTLKQDSNNSTTWKVDLDDAEEIASRLDEHGDFDNKPLPFTIKNSNGWMFGTAIPYNNSEGSGVETLYNHPRKNGKGPPAWGWCSYDDLPGTLRPPPLFLQYCRG